MPFIVLTVVMAILFIIFGMVTYKNIQRQDAEYVRLTNLKGESLIRTVEAGVRFGMRIDAWGNQRLQQLLMETGQQPDIEYIFLVDFIQLFIHSYDQKCFHTKRA